MLEKYIYQFEEDMRKKAAETDSVALKKAMDKLEKLNDSIAEEYIFRNALLGITSILFMHEVNEEETEEALAHFIDNLTNEMEKLKNRYVFKVELKGYEDKINRILTIPQNCSLSDLGIGIILAFHGEFSHLMRFTINRKKYSIYFDEDVYEDVYDEDAREWSLEELNLKKTTKIKLEYDFGEGYEFMIKLISKEKSDSLNPHVIVKDGEGYGIWEDNFYLLQRFYENPDMSMIDYIGEDIALKDFIDFDPYEFDSEEINEYIRDNFSICKENCEEGPFE